MMKNAVLALIVALCKTDTPCITELAIAGPQSAKKAAIMFAAREKREFYMRGGCSPSGEGCPDPVIANYIYECMVRRDSQEGSWGACHLWAHGKRNKERKL